MPDTPEVPQDMLPWERPGYGFSGPLDPLHTTRSNERWLNETRDAPPAPKGDIGAAVLLFEDKTGQVRTFSLEGDSPVDPDDFDQIRRQYPHLR